MIENPFQNKLCKLEKKDGFGLTGYVIDYTPMGVVFATTQKTSFIAWDTIKEIRPVGE